MSSWLKAAVITAVQTFLATAVLTVLGLLAQVQQWVDDGTSVPDWSAAARLLGSAFVALVAGLLTAVWRYIKPPEDDYRGVAYTYDDDPRNDTPG